MKQVTNLITKVYTQDGTGVTSEQYHSINVIHGFSMVSHPFHIALSIAKLDFYSPTMSLLGTMKVSIRSKYNGHAKTATVTK